MVAKKQVEIDLSKPKQWARRERGVEIRVSHLQPSAVILEYFYLHVYFASFFRNITVGEDRVQEIIRASQGL